MVVKVTKIPATQVLTKVDYLGKKRRIGLLGGTFNPPHLGHSIIADQVLSQLGLDEVLFMPDNLPPHIDSKETIAAEKRLKMVELSIADNPNFGIEDIELKRGGISYTYDTIKQLTIMHPENEYYFIIGGDMVDYLPKWNRIDDLIKMVKFIGVQRKGFEQKSKYPLMWVDVPMIGVSSSLIREKISQHCSIRYLVKKEVADYIEKEGLYK